MNRRPNNKGYAAVDIAGKRMYAHRAMWEQERSPIPDGMYIDHLCRTPLCINPDHLEVVTHAENLRRGKGAKITAKEVEEIRSAPLSVTTRSLATRYGLSESHCSRVRRGLRW
jgi:hypothetical protein